MTFALFLSQIISIIDQLKITTTKFKRHVQEVEDYLRFNRCSRNLKNAVREFYDFHYRQRIFDEDMIFAELNPILLDEVITCGIVEVIQDCELFRSCRLDFQRLLCKAFKAWIDTITSNFFFEKLMFWRFFQIKLLLYDLFETPGQWGFYVYICIWTI